jgi:hypothetical protein
MMDGWMDGWMVFGWMDDEFGGDGQVVGAVGHEFAQMTVDWVGEQPRVKEDG